MNFSVLYFFKFALRMPRIAQILVSTLKIFRASMPPHSLRKFLFFFFFFSFSPFAVPDFGYWLISFKFGVMIDTSRLHSLIPVYDLDLDSQSQGYEKVKLVEFFLSKVAWNNPDFCHGWLHVWSRWLQRSMMCLIFNVLSWMFEHGYLDICCRCHICMCFIFWYLYLFSAVEHVLHRKALYRNNHYYYVNVMSMDHLNISSSCFLFLHETKMNYYAHNKMG